MKKFFILSFTVLMSIISSVLFTNFLVFAVENQSQTITVTATVRPLRLIVVDKTLTIQQIVSNTKEDIRPLVVLDSMDGKELPYSESILAQYQDLKPTLNFSKPGIIYKKEDRPIQSFYKKTQSTISKWLQLPF